MSIPARSGYKNWKRMPLAKEKTKNYQIKMTRLFAHIAIFMLCCASVRAAQPFVSFQPREAATSATTGHVQVDDADYAGVKRAARTLVADMQAACGRELKVTVGSLDKSRTIQQLVKNKTIDGKELKGKTEKYIIRVDGDGSIIIAGSDKRGTIYGIYELSRQLGVNAWSWWADMPVVKHDSIYLIAGQYTDGEPVVRYRGIFLNDEAPCLSNWVREKFPDSECPSANPQLAHGFNSHFYERVFELLQRLKANYMWPTMWGNAFYADDSQNSALADEMGIIMGTSHHEPMARNHQEWARHRRENGPWDYVTNQKVIDDFFREGIRRAKGNEDIITIGMRGDGDAAMGGKEGHDDEFERNDQYYIKLYEKIFRNQRQIIKEETGRAPEKRVQLWALYKEVQRYYDLGLTVPEDVIILLCDDNWGNIRRVPTTAHKGGYGMYYHVDYVGAPRNTKWANVTPAAHLWEQMQLCCQYGIDKLWILNVGDLKPMEYPIQLFLDMAWNPAAFADPKSIGQHTEQFCNNIFANDSALLGEGFGREAARLLTRYTTFNGRCTPEMLTSRTYNLASGEWQRVSDEYSALATDAVTLYDLLNSRQPNAAWGKSAYEQLLLYPIQSMANVYAMYYAQARGDQQAINRYFERDSLLTVFYHNINGGKWNHLMRQMHIGYRSWNDLPRNVRPQVRPSDRRADAPQEQPAMRPESVTHGGHIYRHGDGHVVIEAEHYASSIAADGAQWLTIPNYGRTLSGVAHWPYTTSAVGASLTYRFTLPQGVTEAKVHVITNSTLPFLRREGHRYMVSADGQAPVEVNYNSDLTEDNQWHMYDVVATRIIDKTVSITFNASADVHTLTISPIDPGLVLERVVVEF